MDDFSSARENYDCPICDDEVTFTSELEFESHMAEHCYSKCPHCSNLYTRDEILSHLDTSHRQFVEQWGPYQVCKICQKTLDNKTFATHVKDKHEVSCPICACDNVEVNFVSNKELHNHFLHGHKFIKCAQCETNVFLNPSEVENHMKEEHKTNKLSSDHDDKNRKRKSRDDDSESCKTKFSKGDFEKGKAIFQEIGDFDVSEVEYAIPENIEIDGDEFEIGDSDEFDNSEIHLKSDQGSVDVSQLSLGEYCLPSKLDKDPLKGFWFTTIMECLACSERPSRKFQSLSSWAGHLKTNHSEQFDSISQYKKAHGDPDLLKLKHSCYICGIMLTLNHGVVNRHLMRKHITNITEYQDAYRNELLSEKANRPKIPSAFTFEGWWEGCLYKCKLCELTFSGNIAFENHLSQAHKIVGNKEIEEKYLGKFEKLWTLLRKHQCFECGAIIRHEYKQIFQHLGKHRLDLETYALKHKTALREELLKKRMEYVVEKYNDSHSQESSLESYIEKMRSQLDDGNSFDPMECWYDGSEHECAICNKIFWSNLKFHTHIKKEHRYSSTKDYRAEFGDPEKTLRQHKCQICGSLVKWEACRIRDHLRLSHKEPQYPKMSLKQYGMVYKDVILQEVYKVKYPHLKLEVPDEEKKPIEIDQTEDLAKKENIVRLVGTTGRRLVGEIPEDGYTKDEWRNLHARKVHPSDKLDCPHCEQKVSRHSMKRHVERLHMGIFNSRDLERLKAKQLQLAKQGIARSLKQLMKSSGGIKVVSGKQGNKREVVIDDQMFQKYKQMLENSPPGDIESRINLITSGLCWDEIEPKLNLVNSGLRIQKIKKEEKKRVTANFKSNLESLESLNSGTLENMTIVTDDSSVTIVPQHGDQTITIDHIPEVETIDMSTNYQNYVVNQETGEIIVLEPTEIVFGEGDLAVDFWGTKLDGGNSAGETDITGVNSGGDIPTLNYNDNISAASQAERMEVSGNFGENNHFNETIPYDHSERIEEIEIEQAMTTTVINEDEIEPGQILTLDERAIDLKDAHHVMREGKECDELEDATHKMIDCNSDISNQVELSLGNSTSTNEGYYFQNGELLVPIGSNSVKDSENNLEEVEVVHDPSEESQVRTINLGIEDDNYEDEHVEEITTIIKTENLGNFTVTVDSQDCSASTGEQALEDESVENIIFVTEEENGEIVYFEGSEGKKGQVIYVHKEEKNDEGVVTVVEDNVFTVDGEQIVEEICEDGGIETNWKEGMETKWSASTCVKQEEEVPIEGRPVISGGGRGKKKKFENTGRFVSRTRMERSGRVSQGTSVSNWTKMPGDRVRVASNRVVWPSNEKQATESSTTIEMSVTVDSGTEASDILGHISSMETNLLKLKEEYLRKKAGEENRGDLTKTEEDSVVKDESPGENLVSVENDGVADTLLYSNRFGTFRDVATQVVPHHVTGLPTNNEQEDSQKEQIINFISNSGTLDRTCPGCGKHLSRQRNLISHIEIMHGIRVSGFEIGLDSQDRWLKENIKQTCKICQKVISRKSMKRHIRLNHSKDLDQNILQD